MDNQRPIDDESEAFASPILRSPRNLPKPPETLRTPRLFLREPGWQITVKQGSERLFCYLTHPGEDHYHRIMDSEIFLTRDEEKICLPCAERRGLLSFEPKRLRDPSAAINFLMEQIGDDDLLRLLSWEEIEAEYESEDSADDDR
jgi:hypothetical protein